MSLNVLHVCMYTCHACGGQKKALDPPSSTGLIDGCEPPFWFCELNLGLLQEQEMLLTIKSPFHFLKCLLSAA